MPDQLPLKGILENPESRGDSWKGYKRTSLNVIVNYMLY